MLNSFHSVSSLLLMLLIGWSAVRASAAPAQAPADVAALCDKYEAEIRKKVAAGSPVEAILAAADYDAALRGCTPPPVFADGKFESGVHPLEFTAPFAKNWKKSATDTEETARYAAIGVDVLLTMDGPTAEEHLMVLNLKMDMMLRRMGMSADNPNAPNFMSNARQMASQVGQIESEQAAQIGGLEGVRFKLRAQRGVEMAAVSKGGCLYCVIVTGDRNALADKRVERMDQLLAAIKFRERPAAMIANIVAIRARIPAAATVEALLASVRELALIGEYREANLQLANARAKIAEARSRPKIVGNDIEYSAYLVSLKNPDPKRWKPLTQPTGTSEMIAFQDKTSVNEAFIAVLVMDPILTLGPGILKEIDRNGPEEKLKGMLKSMGRGALLGSGGKIEEEHFRQFHGRVAYEGIVTMNGSNMKIKGIMFRGSRALYIVMLVAAPGDLQEYEKALDSGINVADDPKP